MVSMTTGEQPRRGRSTRLIAAGAVFGALLALLAVILLGGGGTGSGPGPLADDSSAAPTTTTPPPLQAPAGTCLTWSEVDASDAERVDCAAPHLFEVTGTIDLATRFGPTVPFPSDDQWRQLVSERCTPLTDRFLDGDFDPFGRFSVGAIKPSQASWRQGDRELRCGLQVVGRSGALYATTGKASTQDQSDVHEPGTCLGNDGLGVGDPVDCAAPHAVEVVAVVDLGEAFGDGYTAEDEQDRVLEEECTRLAAEYAGGPDVVSEKGLTVFWETLRQESWEAGSRRVDCRLGAFLPDRSGFAPVTGSVKGEVEVGTEPAPPAPTSRGPAPTVSQTPASRPPSPSPSPPG
ncbi:MAG: hypothetical protein GEV09_22105 [Pseudonocardiaceae bacterium]|nr:hypothetical protein [Pseudonocardiaceae bacterium]